MHWIYTLTKHDDMSPKPVGMPHRGVGALARHARRTGACLKPALDSVAVGSTIALVLFLVCPFARGEGVRIGDKIPAFSAFKLEGQIPVLKGHVVLLDFWASWCPPCKASLPVLDEISSTYASNGLMVVAVSVDEKATDMERFLKEHPMSKHMNVLHDTEGQLATAFAIESMPTTLLIDRNGVVRSIHKGFSEASTRTEWIREIKALLKP
jgi:thiol-disulfide isomerase/thioredoxin